MMERYIKYIAVLAAVITVCAGMTAELTVDKTELMPGDAVKFTLDIKEMTSSSVINWIKVNDGMENARLANNHIVNDEDYSDRHWKTELITVVEREHYQITLNMTDVQLADAGVYRCEFTDGGVTVKTNEITLNVIISPQVIKFFFDDKEVGQGDEFEVVSDSVHKLRCEVNGAAPAPQVDIFAGHKKVSAVGDEFITDTERSEGDEVFPLLYAYTYDVTVSGAAVTFDSRFANKMVKCSVKGPGGQMSSAAFKAKFPGVTPTWSPDCPKEVVSYSGQTELKLTCELTASPPATVEYVWRYRNPAATDAIRVTADMPAKKFPSHYNAKLEKINDETQKAILIMDTVHPQMFRNYTFIARNSAGESEYVVTLVPDPSKEVKTTNSAVFVSASILLAYLSSTLFFLLH